MHRIKRQVRLHWYLNLANMKGSFCDSFPVFISVNLFLEVYSMSEVKRPFQSWRASPLLDLRNWDRGTKMGRFSEFRGWKLWREKTQSSSRHARVLLWSMNLSFSLTGSLSRLPRRCTCEKYIYCHVSIRGGPCCTDWSSLVFIKLKIHDKDH